jgi:hypothetical protein
MVLSMPAAGTLIGLSADELNTIRAAALQCITAAAVRGVSYSIAGRNFSFPSLESAGQMLMEVNYALGLLTGQRSMSSRANFNPALGKGSPWA